MQFDDLLAAAAENMVADLRRRLINHPGELGTAREQIIREFLASHIPKRFEVSTGFVFDCTGSMSKQLDVIIFDADVCPRFEVPGGKFLFPCEAVAAVGQIKSSMNSRAVLQDAMENVASVKSLDRSANGMAFDSRFNERLSPRDNHLHQIFTFIIVINQSLTPESIAQTILEDSFNRPVELLPNLILGLDRFLLTYSCNGGVCPTPTNARGVAIQSSEEPHDVFMRFYLLLGQALNVVRTASLPFWEYLSSHKDLPALVYHSCAESPPPYLGQWTRGE